MSNENNSDFIEVSDTTESKSKGWGWKKITLVSAGVCITLAAVAGGYSNQDKIKEQVTDVAGAASDTLSGLVDTGGQGETKTPSALPELTTPEPLPSAPPSVVVEVPGLGVCEGVDVLVKYEIQTTLVCHRDATFEEVKAGGTIPKG